MLKTKLIVSLSLLALSTSVNLALSEERRPMDYINAAKEYLPYSCKKLALYVEDDEAEMAEAVGYMIAVSVINREIDLEKIIQTDEEKAAFQDDMAASIRSICETDVDTLMISAVDQSIVKLLAE